MIKLNLYKIADLYEMSSGISSTPEQAGHGAPFVSFSTVFKDYFLPDELDDLMYTSEKEKITYSVKEGDIFLTRTSETLDELGMSSVAIKDYPDASYSGFLKRLRPIQEDLTYHKYMAFYLRSYLFRKAMNNNAIMTLRASLNEQIFSYIDLVLPEKSEQIKIGDFLYRINHKIEINKKINAELEAIAKLIYDYWFIQFDFPDKNGKPYKSSGGKMVWNKELKRDIPEGWETSTVGKVADVRKGELITEKEAIPGNVKVIAAGIEYSYHHNKPNRLKNTITVSGSGASAGIINFWREPIFASDCVTIRGAKDIDTILIRQYLFHLQAHLYKQARGSAQPHVYPDDVKMLPYIIPKENLILKIEDQFINWNNKIAMNNQEIEILTKLRDWLLPMLMNGQVTVGDIRND